MLNTQDSIQSLLPSPADNPQADVVIYDGECQFCEAQVQRLRHLDGKRRLAFISLHDPWVQKSFPDLSHEQLMEEIVVVDGQKNRHGGAGAFRYLTRRLPALWILAPLMHIPFTLPIWKWGYRLIARHRYRWNKKRGTANCENDTCDIHFEKRPR